MGGGKSGGAGQTYNYYGTLAGGICLGPCAELVATIINSQEVWPKGTPWSVGITCAPGTLYVFDAQTWTCTSSHVATNNNAPGSGLEGWTEYTFQRTSELSDDFPLTASDDTYYGINRIFWGASGQTVDPLLESTGNDGGVQGNLGSGDQHPDYEGICYSLVDDFLLGQEVQSGPNLQHVIRCKANQSLITGDAANITDGQVNLAAEAVVWLTDPNFLGEPTSIIDLPSFQAVADWLQIYQDKYGASVLIDSLESITSLFDKLTEMIDGYVRFNCATKKVELGVYQHGVTPGSPTSLQQTYVTITEDDLTKFPKFDADSWMETINTVVVDYNPRQLNYQQTSSPPITDPRGVFILGQVRSQTLDRPWICRDPQAIIHGRETLRVTGHAKMTGELEIRRERARNIREGDLILVDIDLEPNANSLYQWFRVTQLTIPPTGPITAAVFADNSLAPVPWNGVGTPVITSVPAIPPITNFRFLAVPTILAGQRGAIIPLAERPNNLIVGATLYFDTASNGTFNSMGVFSNYAAKGVLHADISAADTALVVDVDTTKPDADFFTQQFSDIQKSNDEMLAFIVQKVSGGADAGQVAESAGYQLMEICSVGAQTLVQAGRYSLAVLRGRQNTSPLAFTAANSEVWLIPRALITPFIHANFATIAANRVQGLTPDHAQFRLCPFSFVNSLALSDATSEPFRFPLNSQSAPTLALTNPNSYALTYTNQSYPISIPINGTWTDPDSNLTGIQVLLRLSTESTDRVVMTQTFSPCASQAFAASVQIEKAGSWTIKIIGRDSTNFTTEHDITVAVTGTGAQCAVPIAFDCNGVQLLGSNGSGPTYQDTMPPFLVPGCPAGNHWWSLSPGRFIPFGKIYVKCPTPGAIITFAFLNNAGAIYSSGVLTRDSGTQNYTYAEESEMPFLCLLQGTGTDKAPLPGSYGLYLWATASGYTDSWMICYTIPLLE